MKNRIIKGYIQIFLFLSIFFMIMYFLFRASYVYEINQIKSYQPLINDIGKINKIKINVLSGENKYKIFTEDLVYIVQINISKNQITGYKIIERINKNEK